MCASTCDIAGILPSPGVVPAVAYDRPVPTRLVLASLAALLLMACGGGDRAPDRAGPLLPEDRLALPQYDLETYHALISELEGTPVVANVWGSWCPPCEAEAPHLAEVSAEFEGQVQFLGIDILDGKEAARDFILKYDWQYPSIFDPTGAIRDGLGYVGQPITIVYDRRGNVAWDHTGAIAAEMLREQIRAVL
jgi:thiol-disulfide isomerase/thioredoxin